MELHFDPPPQFLFCNFKDFIKKPSKIADAERPSCFLPRLLLGQPFNKARTRTSLTGLSKESECGPNLMQLSFGFSFVTTINW